MALASNGFWGGNPELIYNAPTELVMKAYDYKAFTNIYQETDMIINEVHNG